MKFSVEIKESIKQELLDSLIRSGAGLNVTIKDLDDIITNRTCSKEKLFNRLLEMGFKPVDLAEGGVVPLWAAFQNEQLRHPIATLSNTVAFSPTLNVRDLMSGLEVVAKEMRIQLSSLVVIPHTQLRICPDMTLFWSQFGVTRFRVSLDTYYDALKEYRAVRYFQNLENFRD
tara:strand:- start:2775 stop:3293 length:519 start_codon:yes stop_codon:yes gene_type:complete